MLQCSMKLQADAGLTSFTTSLVARPPRRFDGTRRALRQIRLADCGCLESWSGDCALRGIIVRPPA
jgi:hypothetical protein